MSAATVINDELLTEVRGEALREQTCGEIHAAAGRGGDYAHGFVGITLR